MFYDLLYLGFLLPPFPSLTHAKTHFNSCMHTHTQTHTLSLTHIHSHMHICTNTCTHISTNTCMHTCTHTHTCAHTQTFLKLHVSVTCKTFLNHATIPQLSNPTYSNHPYHTLWSPSQVLVTRQPTQLGRSEQAGVTLRWKIVSELQASHNVILPMFLFSSSSSTLHCQQQNNLGNEKIHLHCGKQQVAESQSGEKISWMWSRLSAPHCRALGRTHFVPFPWLSSPFLSDKLH